MRARFSTPCVLALASAVLAAACSSAVPPRHPSAASPPRPPAPAAPRAAPARVHRAESAADLLRGPNAAGRLGDLVLENSHVRAVIDDVTGGGGFALSGGQLLDLAPQGGLDELGQVFNFLGRFPHQLRYRTLRTEVLPDGTASVMVSGEDPRTPGLEGETTYLLGPDDRALTLRTHLRNRGTAPAELGLGDAIQWAGAEHWAPGAGFALRGETREDFLAGVGAHVAYAYVAPHRPVFGPNGGNWSDPLQEQVTLAPGAEVTYERRIGVSRGGDVGGALLNTGLYRAEQSVRVRVTDAATHAPIADARITLRDGERHAPVAMGATDERGEAELPVAAGEYAVDLSAPGRAPDAATSALLARPLRVAPRARAELALALGPRSVLAVRVAEHTADRGDVAVPARVLVWGADGTPDPFFGAIGRANGARNSVVVWREPAELALAPGRYRVVATRGPEYALAEQTVTVPEGGRAEASLSLARVVDTRGYLCGDFHSHQAPSLDSPVSLRDRARAAAAEGLEVLATTDHNVATDLTPAVHDEALEPFLLPLGGDEVSTDVALAPVGHWNLYPLVVRPDAPLGGAPNLFELSAADLVARAREVAPGAVVQVNHPRSGAPTGAFDVVGFDRATGRATRGAFAPTFDAIEVWNGRYERQAENVLLDWLALLRQGARITATANSDSHAIVVQEVGWPRTCFRAPSDDVTHETPADVARAIREVRDVVLTDGPFLRVETADGQSAIGRTVRAGRDGRVALRVRVEAPRWSAADLLELVHADGRFEPVGVTWRTEGEVVRGEATVRADAREGFVLFRARGSQRIPTVLDDPPLHPMAISNPVYLAR